MKQLNKLESLELAKPVLQQGKKDLLQKWLTEEKLACSEELGDCIKPMDVQMALSVYLKAEAHQKVIQCLSETGQTDKIALYAQKVNMPMDWGVQIDNMARMNPQAACEMAQKLATDPAGSKVDFNQ
ncbi:armadillo-type protein, partial [Pavlovales sp. CCMP2436]